MNHPAIAPPAGSPSAPIDQGKRAPSVLVVDDDAALCTMLCAMLKAAGYESVGAADGQVGLTLCAEFKYDLVICDMLMPDCDGVELITALRKINPTAAIIAISGGGRVEAENYLRIAKLLGAKAVLRKPFPMTSFMELVKRELN